MKTMMLSEMSATELRAERDSIIQRVLGIRTPENHIWFGGVSCHLNYLLLKHEGGDLDTIHALLSYEEELDG